MKERNVGSHFFKHFFQVDQPQANLRSIQEYVSWIEFIEYTTM